MADGTVELEVRADASKAKKEIDSVGDAAKAAGGEAESAGGGAFRKVSKGASGAEADADGLGSAAKAAGADADGAGASAFAKVKEGAEKAKDAIDAMGGGSSGIMGALGGAVSVAGIVGLADQAAEANSYMSRLEASAEANGVSASTMSDAYSGLVGVLGETDRSVETAGNMFALCGDDAGRLSEMTTALTGAYSQFGDGLPIEGLAEAANETAKVGQVTGSFADALNWVNASQSQWSAALEGHPAAMAAFNEAIDSGMSKEDAFNAALGECTSEQERAQLVTQALSALYGEQGAKYEEANAGAIAYRQAQDEMNSALAEAGEAVMPIVTAALEALTGALQWLVDNGEVVVPVIAGIAAGFLAFMAVQGVITIITGLGTAIAFLTSPIGIAIAAIALIVAAIVALATNAGGCRDMVVNAFWTVVNFIAGIPGQIGAFLSTVISNVISWASEMGAGALRAGSQFLTNVVNYLTQLPSRAVGFFNRVISNVSSFAGEMAAGALRAGSRFLTNIVNELSKIPGRVVSIGGDIVNGLVDGIMGAAGAVTDALTGLASDALSAAKSFLGIASPSKVFRREVGRWIPEGAALGVEDAAGDFRSAVDAAFAYRPDVSAWASWQPAIGGPGAVEISQQINFNQPVQSPAQTARAMRMYGRYGLGAVM